MQEYIVFLDTDETYGVALTQGVTYNEVATGMTEQEALELREAYEAEEEL